MTADDVSQAAMEAGQKANETVRAAAVDTAAEFQSATAAVGEQAEMAARTGADAAAQASRTTSDAFVAARDRLNAVTDAMPQAAQDFFRPFQSGGENLGKGLESSYGTAMEGMAEFNSKAIAAWRTNAESTIRHWQSLVGVRNLSEAIALSAEHTRQQLEAMTAQTRELSTLATRIVRDAANPLKLTGR